jgi:hypothetical protein
MTLPWASRTGQSATDYARSRVGGTMPAAGYCLQFVRECYAVPSRYPSAIAAWNASKTQHPGDRNPPAAVPLYFATPSQYDHVVFGVSPSEIITTFNADIRRYTGNAIAGIERDFQGTYLGWAEDINGMTVYASESIAGGDGFLMALTDQQQDDVYNWLANIAGWVYRGGPDVNAGAADPGSISARTIHLDQVIAGAQETPGNALGRIMNIDRQVTGADGFDPSVSSRVIRIEHEVCEPGGVKGGHHGHDDDDEGHGLSDRDVHRIAIAVAALIDEIRG